MSNIGAQWSYPFGQSYLREQCIAQTVLRTCLKLLKKSSLKYPLPIYCLIFFVTTTTILFPPTPRLSILKSKNINCYNLYVVAQFYPWSKFYFLLF